MPPCFPVSSHRIMCAHNLWGWQDVGLPTTMTDIGVDPKDAEAINLICAKACDVSDSMKNMPDPITPNDVVEAMHKAHELGVHIKNRRSAGTPDRKSTRLNSSH